MAQSQHELIGLLKLELSRVDPGWDTVLIEMGSQLMPGVGPTAVYDNDQLIKWLLERLKQWS